MKIRNRKKGLPLQASASCRIQGISPEERQLATVTYERLHQITSAMTAGVESLSTYLTKAQESLRKAQDLIDEVRATRAILEQKAGENRDLLLQLAKMMNAVQ